MALSDLVHFRNLEKCYTSLESKLGYAIILGGARHHGYYNGPTSSPFPISKALRAMEDHLFNSLHLGQDALVLDAGCGTGEVAISLAKHGLIIRGIDILDYHLQKAQENIRARRLENVITVQRMDYHDLSAFTNCSFDGVFTMETFVHAKDPEKALGEFIRVLRPGGSIALYEYEHLDPNTAPLDLRESWEKINRTGAMPAFTRFDKGVLLKLLEDAGFQEVSVTDLSMNVRPMTRLFYMMAYLPWFFIRFLGLERSFFNTMVGIKAWRGRQYWKYIAVTARKPRNDQK